MLQPFSSQVLAHLPPVNWTAQCGLTDDTLGSSRIDLTHLNIVSIDPTGCSDIDDALSFTSIGPGLYELGVHIADVAYFVRPGSVLDAEAKNRATSVYLQERRLDMLPARLCEDLASLRPKLFRLAVSVLWTYAYLPFDLCCIVFKARRNIRLTKICASDKNEPKTAYPTSLKSRENHVSQSH